MFEKEKKYFPIKTKTACQLKWNWSTIILTEGTTSSCHRCLKVPLDKDNFDSFHNLPHKIKEREIMLQGKWPTKENGGSGHCTYCKDVEDAGGLSDRQHHLQIPNLNPDELKENFNATIVTPTILEVFMNKTCNLKCTYCNTANSSQINAEAKLFGPILYKNGKEHTQYNFKNTHVDHRFYFEKTLEWIEKHGNKLKRLHLLGGETFYQKELDEMITVLKKLKNRNLELNIVSNLMTKEEIFKKYIEQIKTLILDKNIGRFDLTASIDGWGEEAEYARTGLKIEHFIKLFNYVVDQKWIFFNINQTITSLTVKSSPDLIKFLNEKRKQKTINHEIGFVIGRPHMHPGAYGKDFWKDDFSKILNMMPEDNQSNILVKKHMSGLLNSVPTTTNQKLVNELKYFLDQLDQRRNTNWRKICPHLDI
jgi:pyruvate-formate lyase-activating enzyme